MLPFNISRGHVHATGRASIRILAVRFRQCQRRRVFCFPTRIMIAAPVDQPSLRPRIPQLTSFPPLTFTPPPLRLFTLPCVLFVRDSECRDIRAVRCCTFCVPRSYQCEKLRSCRYCRSPQKRFAADASFQYMFKPHQVPGCPSCISLASFW